MNAPLDKRSSEHSFDNAGTRPLSALLAGARFLINLEDTEQFFKLTDALDGRQQEKNFRRYARSAQGAKMISEGVNFIEILSDEKYLNRQPAGSLAHAYLGFLKAENLCLQDLMNAEISGGAHRLSLDSARLNYIRAGTANHDLLHVLTQYGRDPIGESMMLLLTGEQLHLRGVTLISHAMAMRERTLNPRVPISKMQSEARSISNCMTWLPEIDWRDLLPMPLQKARDAINLKTPGRYLRYKSSQNLEFYELNAA